MTKTTDEILTPKPEARLRIYAWTPNDPPLSYAGLIKENCSVSCKPCHAEKTGKQDIPAIAKTKRIRDRERGIRRPSRFPGARTSRWKKKMDGSVIQR